MFSSGSKLRMEAHIFVIFFIFYMLLSIIETRSLTSFAVKLYHLYCKLGSTSIAHFSLETEVVIRMFGRVSDGMRFSLDGLFKNTVY